MKIENQQQYQEIKDSVEKILMKGSENLTDLENIQLAALSSLLEEYEDQIYPVDLKPSITLKDLVTNKIAEFDRFVHGSEGASFYYTIGYYSDMDDEFIQVAEFPIPIEDVQNTTLSCSEKAITLMRWIRKAMDDSTLIEIN